MMGPYDSSVSAGSSSGGSSTSCSPKPHPDHMDCLLAGAGYKVRSTELHQVAQRLERLETVMQVNSFPFDLLHNDAAVYYNPSHLSSFVDSLLNEFNQPPFNAVDDVTSCAASTALTAPAPLYHSSYWTEVRAAQAQAQARLQPFTVVTPLEEDLSIRIVHVLMACAEEVQRGDFSLAGSLAEEVQALLTRVNSECGIGKVASFFIDALSRKIFTPQAVVSQSAGFASFENEILYHHYYEACPYLKFAHFTANQAILEAFEGQDCVHVIDFNLMHGLQWPALIQALALRPGGPPVLRLTGIGPPSPDGRDSLREIGLKLAELARSVNVRFAFRGVAASQLDDVKPWMLEDSPKETIAVNSIMQLHKLLGSSGSTVRGRSSSIDYVLDWIRSLNPKIVTVVEQESNHNQPEFLDRFTEALYYYSTMFDSMEACTNQPEKSFAELYIQREICNVVSCEGSARVERHEPLAKWRDRLTTAGFKPFHLGSNAFKQASMLLTLFSAEGYCLQENEGCLTLGWHSRPLIAASAWHVEPEPNRSTVGFTNP